MEYTRISVFVFLYHLLTKWSIAKALEKLSKTYKSKNFLIVFFWFRIWVLQTNDAVKKVLSSATDTKLTFLNKNFIRSHGHFYGIGNLDSSDSDDSLHHIVHTSLKMSLDVPRLESLMYDHCDIITHKYGFRYDMNSVLSEYIMTIWAKYCFGDSVDISFYKSMRDKTVDILGKTFYTHSSSNIPYIGALLCKARRIFHSRELAEIDDMLNQLISAGQGGFIHKFRDNIYKFFGMDQDDVRTKIVLDNAFLSILAFDFMYIFLQGFIMKISSDEIDGLDKRKEVKNECLKSGFLFPYRMRYINRTAGSFNRGDFAIVNLTSSGLYFSYGLRSCVGISLVNKLFDTFCEIINPYMLRRIDNNPVTRSTNENIPLITSKHEIELTIPIDGVIDVIDCFPHKGIQKFYRIESVTENINFYKYVCRKMADIILELKKTNRIDFLIMAESRGFIFSPVSVYTDIPFITIRKNGKTTGKSIKESYQKTYDDVQTVEMSVNSPIHGKNVIIVDDGVACGLTSQAVYNLVKRSSGHVLNLVVCFKHTYVENKYHQTPISYLFTL